jgi:antitoxin PrlF
MPDEPEVSFRVRLTSKNQITLPPEIRERLGLKVGDRVEFVVKDGKMVLQAASPA